MSHAIIAIDDEPHNLMLLESYFDDSNYKIEYFASGTEALRHLEMSPPIDLILLDRMMPGMDGMAFMRALKNLKQHATTPIIMQTAAAGSAEIAEGIAAGAYYYLTKPYARDVLTAIVSRALADHAFHQGMQKSSAQITAAIGQMESICLAFRTLDDVRAVSFFLASLYPDPNSAIMGVTELMLNAVEHGNLGITYADKSKLMRQGTWEAEVNHRLELPENRGKSARVWFEREKTAMVLTIEDMGAGFDWTPYVGFDSRRARDSHGRGIAMSCMISFDEVTYSKPGNKVVCRKHVAL